MRWRLQKLDWRYGLGELLIVTAGVLVALYIEQWNSDRLDRQEEQAVIRRLLSDLESDMENIELGLSLVAVKIPALERLLSRDIDTLHGPSGDADLIADLRRSASWGWQQNEVRPTTYNELIGSGRFNLIRDPELRSAIAQYYRIMEIGLSRVSERETAYPALFMQLAPNEDNPRLYSSQEQAALLEKVTEESARALLLAEENFAFFARRILLAQQVQNMELAEMLQSYLGRL